MRTSAIPVAALAAAALPLLLATAAVAEGQLSAPSAISSAEQAPAVAVAVETVGRGSVPVWLAAEGTARAVRREILHFGRAGRVVEIGLEPDGSPLREGSEVNGPRDGQPGQLIGRIDQREQSESVAAQSSQAEAALRRVEAARGAVQEARAALAQADQSLARVRDLAGKGIVPRKQLDEAQAARATAAAQVTSATGRLAAAEAEADAAASQSAEVRIRLEQTELRAPFDGIISFMNMVEGDYVAPLPAGGLESGALMRQAAAVVMDPSQYEILVEIPSYQGLPLTRGLPAEIAWGGSGLLAQADGAPPGTLPIAKAEVYAVAPAIAPDSRTIRLRLRTLEGAEHLRDGLYVNARILVSRHDDVLRVPVRAVRYDAGQPHVFVVGKDGIARRAPIAIGVGDGRMLQVLSGLDEGAAVVVAGQEALSDGAAVRIIGRES